MKLSKITSLIAFVCITLAFASGILFAEDTASSKGGNVVYLTIKPANDKVKDSGITSVDIIEPSGSIQTLYPSYTGDSLFNGPQVGKFRTGPEKFSIKPKGILPDGSSIFSGLIVQPSTDKSRLFGRPGDQFEVKITTTDGNTIVSDPKTIKIPNSPEFEVKLNSKIHTLNVEWNNDGWHFIITVYGDAEFPDLSL